MSTSNVKQPPKGPASSVAVLQALGAISSGAPAAGPKVQQVSRRQRRAHAIARQLKKAQ